MIDARPARLCAISRLSRRDWLLLPYPFFPRTTVLQEGARVPSFLGALVGHVFQSHREQKLSKKAKWIQ
jgi:hypothetical protein